MAAVSWNADATHRLRRRMRGSLNEQTCGNKPLNRLAVASRRRSTFSHKGRREETGAIDRQFEPHPNVRVTSASNLGDKMQMKSGRLAVLAVSLLGTAASTASAAPATASGPAALALAGVVALYSPLLTADEREAVSAFFVGQSGVRYAKKISVTADKIVCKRQQRRHHRALLRTDLQGRQADHHRTPRQRNLCHGSDGRRAARRRRGIDRRKPLEADLHARSGRDQAEGRRRRELLVRDGELNSSLLPLRGRGISKMCADCRRLRSLERGTFRAGCSGNTSISEASCTSLELGDVHHSPRS